MWWVAGILIYLWLMLELAMFLGRVLKDRDE